MGNLPPVFIVDSRHGELVPFVPKKAGKVTFYSCGPTVYGLIHVGNLRAAITADLVVRSLKHLGYEVTFARNYTDIEDKIIDAALEQKIDAASFANNYIVEVEKDYAAALLGEPNHKPKATEYIPQMIAMIGQLIQKGFAYVTPQGEVLFEVARFKDYGKFSRQVLEDLIEGLRVKEIAHKKSPLDFTLWKPAKPGEPHWSSPWGEGRPGWHIECSAMSYELFGEEIDLHHGGEDLVFPHHENEIAQSECANGHSPFVRHWIHHAHITLDKVKMSKSLGNLMTAREFLQKYSGEIARVYFLSSHYRSRVEFSEEAMDQALKLYERIYSAKQLAVSQEKNQAWMPDAQGEELWGSFLASCEQTRRDFKTHIARDFNTPEVFASLFKLLREYNRLLGLPMASRTPAKLLGSQELIAVIERDFAQITGVGRKHPSGALEDLNRIRSQGAVVDENQILNQIAKRTEAKQAKNFALADEIRKNLEAQGVVLKDGPNGTTWSRK